MARGYLPQASNGREGFCKLSIGQHGRISPPPIGHEWQGGVDVARVEMAGVGGAGVGVAGGHCR